MYELNQPIPVTVHLYDRKIDLDEAFKVAEAEANLKFGADDRGYLNNVNGWQRSCCSVRIDFVGVFKTYGMGGQTYGYMFSAKAEMNEEDERNGESSLSPAKLTCNQAVMLLDIRRGFNEDRHPDTLDKDLNILMKRGLIVANTGSRMLKWTLTETGLAMVENILNQTR